MVLVELGDLKIDDRLKDAPQECLEAKLEDGSITDAILCQNLRESEALWSLRHSFSEANKRAGHGIVLDASLRVKSVPEFIERAISTAMELAPWATPMIVSQLGDGNVHLITMLLKEAMHRVDDLDALTEEIFKRVHNIVDELDGSFSAEHGIGRKLVEEMAHRQPAAEIALMQAFKAVIDPRSIMSPGVLLDPVTPNKPT